MATVPATTTKDTVVLIQSVENLKIRYLPELGGGGEGKKGFEHSK